MLIYMGKWRWLAACLLSGLAQAAGPQPAGPSPQLDPAQVVRAQLSALQRGSSADMATVFRFASPGNRMRTGPAARFEKMLRQGYPELICHLSVRLTPTVVDGDQAVQGVELIAQDGRSFQYVFMLTRQAEEPCVACWMTDSVLGKPDIPREQGT